ncbi:MAG: hypothetical protein DRG30_04560 [Epsilonproteobacteria bacterium]|nr:MAG: hypothetical protein DRG30_04560 [Campylobacterota bacterium]
MKRGYCNDFMKATSEFYAVKMALYDQIEEFEDFKEDNFRSAQLALPHLPGAKFEVLLRSPGEKEEIVREFVSVTHLSLQDWWLQHIKKHPERFFWHFFYSPIVTTVDGKRFLKTLIVNSGRIEREAYEYYLSLIPKGSENIDFGIAKKFYLSRGLPLPDIMVWTGRDAYLYFYLDKTYSVEQEFHRISLVYEFLNLIYGIITKPEFSPRYMVRVPGSWRVMHKRKAPFLVSVYPVNVYHWDVLYSLDELYSAAQKYIGILARKISRKKNRGFPRWKVKPGMNGQ